MVYRQTERSRKVRERSRTRILRMARRLLSTRGYEGTTMEQIATEAGTSIGNLYFYFRNKEALLEAVVMSELTANGARVDARLADIPPGPLAVAVGMYTYLEALFEEPEIARIFMVGEKHESVRRRFVSAIIERVKDRLPLHIHEMKAKEAELMAVAEVGAVFSLVGARLSGTISVTPDEFFRFLTRLRLRICGLPPEEEDATISRAEAVVGWVEGRSWTDLDRSAGASRSTAAPRQRHPEPGLAAGAADRVDEG